MAARESPRPRPLATHEEEEEVCLGRRAAGPPSSSTWTPCQGRWLPLKRTTTRLRRARPARARTRSLRSSGGRPRRWRPRSRSRSSPARRPGRSPGAARAARPPAGRDPRGSAAAGDRARRRARPSSSPGGPRPGSSPRGRTGRPGPRRPRTPSPAEVVVALEDDLGPGAREQRRHQPPRRGSERSGGRGASGCGGRWRPRAALRRGAPSACTTACTSWPRAARPCATSSTWTLPPVRPGTTWSEATYRSFTPRREALLEDVFDVADDARPGSRGSRARKRRRGDRQGPLEEAGDAELLVAHHGSRRRRSTHAAGAPGCVWQQAVAHAAGRPARP